MDTEPEITPEASKLARQFYASQILDELTGRRVRFVEEVERDEFTVEEGATGEIMAPFLHEGRLVAAVRLDDPPPGSEEFEGEVHWIEDETLLDFEEQIELA